MWIDAKFYYTRNVLHGLTDSASIAALKNVAAAMGTESLLVIDDLIIPDEGACTQACQLDFVMMASIAGKKRTRDQWYKLLEAAGFEILQIFFKPFRRTASTNKYINNKKSRIKGPQRKQIAKDGSTKQVRHKTTQHFSEL